MVSVGGILSAVVLLAPALGASLVVDERFQAWDRDADGRLVPEEVPKHLRGNFDRVDRNRDGFIDLEEHLAVVGLPARNTRAEVRLIPDVAYAGDGHPRRRLSLLLPKRPTVPEPLPLIVYIHGGGWKGGHHRDGARVLMDLVATGRFAGATIGYRLTDEVIWPAPYEDCRRALGWIRTHAGDLGIDSRRIVAYGHSAGGHLASMLAVREVGPDRLAGAIDFFGPTDLLAMQSQMSPDGLIEHDASDSPESQLVGGPVQEHPELARSASPIEFVDREDPPLLVIHGDQDRLVPFDQSKEFVKVIREAGGSVVFLEIEGGGHGGFRNPRIFEAVRAFLEHQLHGKGTSPISASLPHAPGG
ncbi:MAG: esterase [Planctomycetaceae bacterium]|nr:esterase [Planctomycetaceae bacterium]